MKQFNNTAILTSKNPEVFLNFNYTGDNYWICPSCNIASGILYVNGIDITKYEVSLGYTLLLSSANNVASFHVYTDKNYPFDVNLRFRMFDSDDLTTSGTEDPVDVSIKNRPYIIPVGLINTDTNENPLIDDEASYLLVRTNPKFTGNVKLVVDTSENMFLDTFKVSDTLSNKKYRHQQVSGNSVLSGDVRNVFSSLPLGELYRVDVDNTLSIAVPKTDLRNQYNITYNYGARLLKDELYVEDNGILAPLWINSKLPDYFAAFRLSGVYNPETYSGSALTNLAFKYLEESDLIKSWGLKPSTPLGKYLTTHLTDVVKFQAPVFLSLTDPSQNESDPNTWYGVAVDKGVIAGRSETTYFFDQKSNNFTDLNAFVSQGFERNNLLCSNIVNMEYIFSDEDVSLYTMSRYFGLYLTENVLYKIAYYSDSPDGSVSILSLDGKDSSIFINSSLIFDSSGNITTDYSNRIFVLNDEIQLQRIKNVNQIDETFFNKYVSKPYKNLFATEIEKTNIQPFITLTLNNLLEQGEHLRIINKSQNKIWEIYGVDATQLKCERYCTVSEDPNGFYPTLYRTFFDVSGNISHQVREIEEAFDRFSEYEGTQFRSGIRGNNWVSIILNDDANTSETWVFQRISAPTLNDFSDPSSGFNAAASPSDITFFGRFTPNASDFTVVAYDSSFGPIDFELYGDRQSIFVDLFKRQNNNLYSFVRDNNILDKFETPTLYQGLDKWYRRLLDFDVITQSSDYPYQYVKDPLHTSDRVLIMTGVDVLTLSNKINAYSIYPLNISLMGINPVKDIDYTVYDSSLGFRSEYFYNRNCDASSFNLGLDAGAGYTLNIQGSFIIKSGSGTFSQNAIDTSYNSFTVFNTFDSSIFILPSTPTIVTYAILDGSYNYTGYSSSFNEENVSDYYYSNQLLKYGLTVPQVSKWVGLGNDCRNNPLRLMLNASTNFIPNDTNYTQEISYPSFKYLGDCGRAWQDYVFFDINDAILDENTSTYKTFKDLMFEYPYADYFSKLVYSNYNVDATKTRSSIAYYNGYKNSVDTIFTGLSLSLQVQNIAKNLLDIKNYDRYRFSFISTPSKNKDNKRPIEVIINENTKTILMIWYQGNDELNYNMRYSSFLPGKSLLDPSNNGFMTSNRISADPSCFVKTPYYVNNSTIQKSILKLYDTAITYDASTARKYGQFNKSLQGFSSAWNAFGDNTISGAGVFLVDSNKSYNTFSQHVEYPYVQNPNTFNDYVVNYGYNYDSNRNWYSNNTTNLITLKYLLSSAFSYVMYYILRGENLYTSYDFGTLNPITITVNPPRAYRNITTYNGWYKPNFNSILDFKSDEDPEFINLVNRDFIFSNTNLRLYNSIPQLWYNKFVTNVTNTDISAGNAISYFTNFNVFKSLWDAEYYYNAQTASYVNGYESADELPAFFGSKLPKLPDNIFLEKWDITTASSSQTSTQVNLSFNLTRAILNLFKTNTDFISNWNGLSNADNIIDSYIKNTILTYYNISQPKIGVNFYYKSADTQLLHLTLDSSDFISDGKQNFNGQLLYLNDEYIYNILIPKTANFSYFVKFVMTEK